MKRRILLVGIVIALSALAAAAGVFVSGAMLQRKVAYSPEEHQRFVTGLSRVARMTLYEGLPHQGWERDALKKELATKFTVRLGGFPFYAHTLTPAPADARALTALFTDRKPFRPYGGAKGCGGFHPDWAVEWQTGEGVERAFVCFTCEEAHLTGPGVDCWCELTDEGKDRLSALLTRYRKNRPNRVLPKP